MLHVARAGSVERRGGPDSDADSDSDSDSDADSDADADSDSDSDADSDSDSDSVSDTDPRTQCTARVFRLANVHQPRRVAWLAGVRTCFNVAPIKSVSS